MNNKTQLKDSKFMKAMVWTNYGPPDVIQLREVKKPTPKDDEVLIRIYAATVTAGDCEIRGFKLPIYIGLPMRFYTGLIKPNRVTILGQELAGEIEAVGKDVTRFKTGDAVFAPTFFHFGAYAEYACLPETQPVLKPANMTYEEAATIPTGGLNGLHFVREAHIQPGQTVLINGAGGSIGTYALQIAKSLGAEVTCVDSAEKLDMLRLTGADHVFDYQKEDFTRNGESYDVIIDVIGKRSLSQTIKALKPNGRYIQGNPDFRGAIRGSQPRKVNGRIVIYALAEYKAEDYISIKELIEAGAIKPVIDKRYPLEQTAEAHRYVDAGHKKGNVIITVSSSVATV
jgi:NADPH:quinone reductase-like Zn-dependent oxidoreductase